VPYSKSMQRLLQDPSRYYTPKDRPSQHSIGEAFGRNNGGALPSNLLAIPNSQSNDAYLRACKTLGLPGHPARFPLRLPAFFIEMLTDPGDLVVDFFGGSNTSGRAAEDLGRRWLSFELDQEYAALSAVRFLGGLERRAVQQAVAQMTLGKTLSFMTSN
jgi:DNA modification methylase